MSDGRRDSIDPNVTKGKPMVHTNTTLVCKFPPIIAGLIDGGVEVIVRKGSFVVRGFYKSEEVALHTTGNTSMVAVDRYGESVDLDELRDLVQLNFDWWQDSAKRGNAGWSQPDPMWVPLLTQFGFITKRTIDVYEPKK